MSTRPEPKNATNAEALKAARELHDQFALGLMRLAQRHLRMASTIERQISTDSTTARQSGSSAGALSFQPRRRRTS